MKATKLWRERWLWLHRWMGIIAGALLVVVGLTGSLYVFVREIRATIDPAMHRVNRGALDRSAYRPWSEILTTAESKKTPGTFLTGIGGPLSETECARVYYSPPQAGSHSSDFHELCIDPYTGLYLGESRLEESWVWKACEFLFRLHYSLALEEVGGSIVGFIALIGIVSILSGLYLWWPGVRRLTSALVIHSKGAGVRRHLDVHRVVGFYFALSLGVVLLSGTWMNFNAQFVALVKFLSPGTQAGEPEVPAAQARTGGPVPDWGQVITRIRNQFPEGYLNWVSIPTEPAGWLVFSFVEVSGSNVSQWSERTVYVDAVSGVVHRVDDPSRRRTWGEGFLAWQWPLHSGRAFGWPGRAVVFLTGFVPLALYVTGFKLWCHKKRSKARHTTKPLLAS